jgi:hypothetical protein
VELEHGLVQFEGCCGAELGVLEVAEVLDRLVDVARVVVAGGVLMPSDHVIRVKGLDRPQGGDHSARVSLVASARYMCVLL